MLNRRTFCFSIAAQLTAQPPCLTSDVTTLLQKGVAEGKLPGAVALVEDDGEVVLLKAVGWRDLKRRERMTADNRIRHAFGDEAGYSIGGHGSCHGRQAGAG